MLAYDEQDVATSKRVHSHANKSLFSQDHATRCLNPGIYHGSFRVAVNRDEGLRPICSLPGNTLRPSDYSLSFSNIVIILFITVHCDSLLPG